MLYCPKVKKNQTLFTGEWFTDTIFTSELSKVDSAGVLRQNVSTDLNLEILA